MSTFVKEYDWMWLPSGLNLSPAECRVYAYIYGLTESKHSNAKGCKDGVNEIWRKLNIPSASRVLHKLIDRNLIVKIGDIYRSVPLQAGSDAPRIENDAPRIGSDALRIESDAPRIGSDAPRITPLTTPLYKEINKEIEREEITREENFDASLSPQEDFFLVTLAAFGLQAGARNVTRKQEQNARVAWQRYSPEQQQALLDAVRKGYNVKGNFQFTVEDFLREQSQQDPDPAGEPINYNGCDPPNVPLAVACYKGEWGLYTLADIEKFNLKTKKQQ